MKKRILSMLVLLAAVATGAWAQWTGGTHTATANENLNAINVSDDATLTINQGVTVTVNGGITVASGKTLTITGGGTLVANGANGGNGDNNQPGNAGGTAIAGNVIINGVGLTVTATGGQGGQGGQGYAGDNGYGDYSGGQGDQGSTGGNGGYAFSDAVTIYAGSVTANGGTGGNGGQGGKGGKGGPGDTFDTGAYGGNGGWGGQGGYGGYAFAGTLTVFGGNVTAYGGAGGAGGAGGDGGDGGQGGGDPGESGEPGDVGDDGGQSNAYANNVTFQATTYTMTDGTNPITDATGKKTVVIQSSDVLPAPAGYAITLAEGTEDADKWTVKVGEGEAQAFPVEGLEGETVTVTYSGTKRVKSVKAVKVGGAPAPVDPLAVPLTIEAITAGIISIEKPKVGMQYSLNGGAKTTISGTGTTTIEVEAGDKVAFYGKGTEITSYGASKISGCTTITGISGMGFTCKVYGNIMSLVDEENFATAKTLSATYTFRNLFNGNVYLTDASGLLLPATELPSYCYYQMFYGCTALTAAPALPATQLASYCYYQMFYNCSALTAAPELPATELASNCYYQMFRGCTALTAAPELPAPTLVSNCYDNMFYGCSKLATVTCLATSGINMSKSTSSWLDGAGSQVDGTKTFNAVSTANWPSGANGIPTGWTRVNIDN